jgi:hypothetical protein
MILRSIGLLLLLTLVGCSDIQSGPAVSVTSTPVPTTNEVQTAEAEPTRENGTPSITGILLDKEGQPVADIGVFLADLSPGPTGEKNVITFSPTSARRGVTDANGRFVIYDVAAGSYSLALWTPASSMLIPDPDSPEGNAILVEVRAGQVTDVGNLTIERPR